MKSVFIFLTGAALGAGVGFFASKKYHEAKLIEYAKELRESWYKWAKMKGFVGNDISKAEDIEEEFDDTIQRAVKVYDKREEERVTANIDKKDYVKMMDNLHYTGGTKSTDYVEGMEEDVIERISEDEFGNDDYDCSTITYFKDGVFVDDELDVMTDTEVMNIVGGAAYSDFMLSCTSEEPSLQDTVYVRNLLHMCDYEITPDSRTYEEFKAMKH